MRDDKKTVVARRRKMLAERICKIRGLLRDGSVSEARSMYKETVSLDAYHVRWSTWVRLRLRLRRVSLATANG